MKAPLQANKSYFIFWVRVEKQKQNSVHNTCYIQNFWKLSGFAWQDTGVNNYLSSEIHLTHLSRQCSTSINLICRRRTYPRSKSQGQVKLWGLRERIVEESFVSTQGPRPWIHRRAVTENWGGESFWPDPILSSNTNKYISEKLRNKTSSGKFDSKPVLINQKCNHFKIFVS